MVGVASDIGPFGVGIGRCRGQPNGFVQIGERLIESMLALPAGAAAVPRLGVLGIELERL
jgi:hypothetical protein